ncbi:hypothetical protein X975_08915, partial [Stegodyphus mimosarum]
MLSEVLEVFNGHKAKSGKQSFIFPETGISWRSITLGYSIYYGFSRINM